MSADTATSLPVDPTTGATTPTTSSDQAHDISSSSAPRSSSPISYDPSIVSGSLSVSANHIFTPDSISSSLLMANRDRDHSTLRLADLEPWMDEPYASQLCHLMGWQNVSIYIPPLPPNVSSLPSNSLQASPASPSPIDPHQSPSQFRPLQPNNPGYLFLTLPTSAIASSVMSQLQNANASQAQNGMDPVKLPNSRKPMRLEWASSADSIAAFKHAESSRTGPSPHPAEAETAHANGTTTPDVPSPTGPSAISEPSPPPVPSATAVQHVPDAPLQVPRAPEYSIFVGDLAPEVTHIDLLAVFRDPSRGLLSDRAPRIIRPFLSCKSAKIMLDASTGVSRGYGFVRFGEESEQRRALIEMQGLYCLSRPMRISHATAKAKGPTTSSQLPARVSNPQTPSSPRSQPSLLFHNPASGLGLERAPSTLSSVSKGEVGTTGSFQTQSVSSPIAAAALAQSTAVPISNSYPGSTGQTQQRGALHVNNAMHSHSSQGPVSSNSSTASTNLPQRPLSSLSYSSSRSFDGSTSSRPMTIHDIPPALVAQIAQLAQSGQLGAVLSLKSAGSEPGAERHMDGSTPGPNTIIGPNVTMNHSIPPAANHFHPGIGVASRPPRLGSNLALSSTSSSSGVPSPIPPLPLDESSISDVFNNMSLSMNVTGNSADPYNTTVFVGGLSGLISEDTLRSFFTPFGDIHYVKIPPGKGCGFVQFVRKADANRAIENMQGFSIGGSKIRLSWGRSQYKAAQAAAQATQLGLNMGELATLTEAVTANGVNASSAQKLQSVLHGSSSTPAHEAPQQHLHNQSLFHAGNNGNPPRGDGYGHAAPMRPRPFNSAFAPFSPDPSMATMFVSPPTTSASLPQHPAPANQPYEQGSLLSAYSGFGEEQRTADSSILSRQNQNSHESYGALAHGGHQSYPYVSDGRMTAIPAVPPSAVPFPATDSNPGLSYYHHSAFYNGAYPEDETRYDQSTFRRGHAGDHQAGRGAAPLDRNPPNSSVISSGIAERSGYTGYPAHRGNGFGRYPDEH